MGHIPVLLKEAIDALLLEAGDVVVDATVGSGGHAQKICELIGKTGTLIGIDSDADAILRTQQSTNALLCHTCFAKNNFRFLDRVLTHCGKESIDAILFDLGFSSDQIEASGRGFSFQKNEPLLMTLKKEGELSEEDLTAREIVNTWEEKHLVDIIRGYGEERYARSIAHAIVEKRKEKPIEATRELAMIIENTVPRYYRHKKIHPATKTFQALRITVNDEIESLKEGLQKAYSALTEEGRIVVISFHSIEDRVVKHFFKKQKAEGKGIVITKKPIRPSRDEVTQNPRSRSAILRVFQKLM